MDVSEELAVAVAAAEAAGTLLRREPTWIWAKGAGGDLSTDLDLRSEELIVSRVRAAYPNDQIVAEESGVAGADGDRVWFVDPLDGTNNIAIGLPVYAVGIAFCVDTRPVVGVVHDPLSGNTWSAVRGGGARGPGLSEVEPIERPLLLAWTQGHAVGGGDPIASALRTTLESRTSRLLQLWAPLVAWIMLARGQIDGLVGYRAELVDFPAGALIAAEAGVTLYRFDGKPFDLRVDLPESERNFIACRSQQFARIRSGLPVPER